MAVKKTKKGYWQVGYRDSDGICRTKSFGKGKEAKKKADAFDAEIKFKKKSDQELPPVRGQGVYFDEIAQEWIQERKVAGRKLGWLEDLAVILNKNFIPKLSLKPAREVTQGDVLAIIAEKYSSHSQSTRNRYIGYIKSIFEYAVDMEYLARNPLKRWKKPKEQSRASQLTLDDLAKLYATALTKDNWLHLAWAMDVAWNIPVRPGKDLFSLTYARNIKHDRGGVEAFHHKVGFWSFIPCGQDFMKRLRVHQLKSRSGFVIEYNGRPVKDLGKGLMTVAKKAGLSYSVCFYDIRHLWITTGVNSGIEPSVIADMAGTSVKMLMDNYYERHSAERTRITEVMPSLVNTENKNVVKPVVKAKKKGAS